MAKETKLDVITNSLLVAGGLNWGLIGLVDVNIVESLLGAVPFLPTVTYVCIGGAGVYKLINMFMD